MSNQLAKVSDAIKATGVSSSLSPNKCITLSEMEALISEIPQMGSEVVSCIRSYCSGSIKQLIFVLNDIDRDIDIEINFGTSKYTRNVKAKGVGALVSYYVEENYTINVVGGGSESISGKGYYRYTDEEELTYTDVFYTIVGYDSFEMKFKGFMTVNSLAVITVS